MTGTALLVLGALLGIEGLVLSLAPARLERVMDSLRDMPPEARRLVGLLALAAGLALGIVGHAMGAACFTVD